MKVETAPFDTILDASEWEGRKSRHETRVRAWTDPHHARAGRGERHPVLDFLFEYYAFRPSWLRRWHPGIGIALSGPGHHSFLRWSEYRQSGGVVYVDPSILNPKRIETVKWLESLLQAMSRRPAFFGCFGFHEWAMVYRQNHDAMRHSAWPLRFSPPELAKIVEEQPVTCTHFDAFRFFTAPARPLNRWQLTRESISDFEQRGCLHANMDLYKWSFKLAPFTPSELIADCFAFAREIREVDMRASPYNFAALDLSPIPIETAAGRTEYERLQRDFARRGEPLRDRLLEVCRKILART